MSMAAFQANPGRDTGGRPRAQVPSADTAEAGHQARRQDHLRRTVRAVFPSGYADKLLTNAGNKIRCALALWLMEQGAVGANMIASGEPASGTFVPLKSVEAYLRSQHAGLWLNKSVFSWPKPADFLQHADSRGVFRVLAPPAALRGGGGGSISGTAAGALGDNPGVQLDVEGLLTTFLQDAERGYGGAAPETASSAAMAVDAAAAAAAMVKAVSALARNAFPGVSKEDLAGGAPLGGQQSAAARVAAAADAACHVRREVVGRLAAVRKLEPTGPLRARMSALGEFLRHEHAERWAECDPTAAGRGPKLKDFLLLPESRGVFRVEGGGAAGTAGGDRAVVLDVTALWRAAMSCTAPSGPHTNAALPPVVAAASAAGGHDTRLEPGAAAAPAASQASGGSSWRAALGGPGAAPAGPAGASGAAPGAPAELLEALRSKPVSELARMAFPAYVDGQPVKDQAARQLRRAIAVWLAGDPCAALGLGPRCARMSDLGHFLRQQHGAVWLDAKRKWPKLKEFVTQQRSLDVFKLLPSPGLAESEPVVQLDLEALVQAVAAVAAARTAGTAGAGAAATARATGAGPSGAGPSGARPAGAAPAAAGPPRQAAQAQAAAGAAAGGASGGRTNNRGAAVEASSADSMGTVTPAGAGAGAAAITFGDGVPEANPDQGSVPQHYDAGSVSSSGPAFPLPSPEDVAAAGLPDAQAVVVADPYGSALVAMLQHCHSCDRLGLAVQSYYGLPTLVTLYAPAALMPLAAPPPEGGADPDAGGGAEGSFIAWPAAVYVVDLLAAKLTYGDGDDGYAAADALLVSLRPLLEAPGVTKVVHDGAAAGGGEAAGGDGLAGTVAVLEAAVSASSAQVLVLGEDGVSMVPAAAGSPCRIAPLHDTRLVLRGLEAMLGLPHSPAAATLDAASALDVSAKLHHLHSHVTRLRDALAATALWGDRPALLATLAARHFAALQHEALEACACGGDGGAVAGMDALLGRPLGAGVVEAVAGDARHLPELWGEMVTTALPWVAERAAAAVHADWEQLKTSGITQKTLQGFIAANFGSPGSDLEAVLPAGWHEEPPAWLAGLPEEEARAFGGAVHQLWKTLCRQVGPDVQANPDRHTLLPLPQPFIVPGDRFRECYNWDSYWVILGLLASGLLPAARQLLSNLLGLVDVWGFVPNGARAYYTNRSQPPLLSAMVMAVVEATAAAEEEARGKAGRGRPDGAGGGECARPGATGAGTISSSSSSSGGGEAEALMREALPRLIAQHGYWTSGPKLLRLRSSGGGGGGAGGGDSRGGGGEDQHLVEGAGLGPEAARALYCDIASAAESGWDFSTRWFVGGDSLECTRTTQIVPADLNAWLYRTELDISHMAGRLGDSSTRDDFAARAADRAAAMDALMWSDADGCWHDLLLQPAPATSSPRPPADGTDTAGSASPAAATAPGDVAAQGYGEDGAGVYSAQQRVGVYASNWVPLWCGVAAPSSSRAAAAAAGLRASGLLQPGGLLTSLYRSGQQWDAPNSWPPLVHMAVEGLERSGAPGAAEAAAGLARSYVVGCRAAWRATGHMHEKYDAVVPGGVGRGGEYVPQVGFGWSNGVLLALMRRYP
ncbi:hypothetical protein HXX76_002402 [Chlamydomonas incerta]|uniref:Trehalase n=1 Tax=Chlamydomonas incerta TaxID=51695 RepID=A0A835W9T2_CHLIN|nr:hypothetical protein HXX76_002402 [Chlamydomonas incerta]|eukprot:KAG2442316.1 hypothetical protein HXX76_002402 [Chlamydomonas incerta]